MNTQSKIMSWLCDPTGWLDVIVRGAIVFGLFCGYIVASSYLTGASIVVMQQEGYTKSAKR